MRSIPEALRERELQVERLKAEIDALRAAARILEDKEDRPQPALVTETAKRWP